jgi:hypothetical protein
MASAIPTAQVLNILVLVLVIVLTSTSTRKRQKRFPCGAATRGQPGDQGPAEHTHVPRRYIATRADNAMVCRKAVNSMSGRNRYCCQ